LKKRKRQNKTKEKRIGKKNKENKKESELLFTRWLVLLTI